MAYVEELGEGGERYRCFNGQLFWGKKPITLQQENVPLEGINQPKKTTPMLWMVLHWKVGEGKNELQAAEREYAIKTANVQINNKRPAA